MSQTVDGYTLLAFLPFIVVAPALGFVLARKSERPWWLLSLTLASLGAVVAVTIGGRMLKLTSWGIGDFVLSWLWDRTSWVQVLPPDRTWVLNAVLFVPAGCLVMLSIRRPGVTILSLSGFSFVIEVVQRWTRLGVADVSDLTANIVGASVGVTVALVAMRIARPDTPHDGTVQTRESLA